MVKGRQTHGAMPWLGVDPVTTAGHILVALQSVAARRVDVTQSPVVISIGAIHGGVRSNIIPDDVTMEGTIRALDPGDPHRAPRQDQGDGHQGGREHGRQGGGDDRLGAPVTFNDPELTQRMVPTLERVAGHQHVTVSPPTTGAEDFSIFQQIFPASSSSWA